MRLPFYNALILEQIRPFVSVLPLPTPVNVNTAPPEVLMAAIPGLSRTAAGGFVQQRTATPFKSVDEITSLLNRLGANQGVTLDTALVQVRSQYWLARSEIRMGRGIFVSTALIERSQTPLPSGNFTQVIWNRTGKMAFE
jgi:general secretion pathway protein K